MKDLSDKVALVTGATRGIGKAIAILLSQNGHKVIGLYANREDLALELEKEIEGLTMYKADIGNLKSLTKMMEFVDKEFGQLDVVVNNAGIFLWKSISDHSIEDWNRMLDVNLTSKFLISKLAIPYLEKSKGVIVNISSRVGMNEYVSAGFVSYCVTNAGINNLTVALAKELEPKGIRVNTVIPSITNTDRFRDTFTKAEQEEVRKEGKLAEPEEIAEMVLDLIKDKSKTGEIVIDKRIFI